MPASTLSQATPAAPPDATGRNLYQIAGVVAAIFVIYSLATMLLLLVIGGQPETAAEAFALLAERRAVGLLRLDVLTLVVMPLYYPLFLSLYWALRRTQPAYASLAALLAFAGITLVLATPSAASLVSLSDRFAAAAPEAERAQLLAAGEAILASDLWHGSGAITGAVLVQVSGVLVSVLMLWHQGFSDLTAGVGIMTHGLDLAHILAGLLLPELGVILMAVAGPLYLVWFPLLARDLFRLERRRSQA